MQFKYTNFAFLTSLIGIFLLFIPQVHAIPYAPSITVLEPISHTKLYFNDDTGYGYRNAEITPWTLENNKLGGEYLYLVTSYNTHLCSTPTNIFSLTQDTRVHGCSLRQSSTITLTNQYLTPDTPLWSRDYYGAFTGHIIDVSNVGKRMYIINHGELTNNNYFPPPDELCTPAPDIGYGTFSCDPANFGISYNGFIGMSHFDWTYSNYISTHQFIDSGPIVWPSNGYVENGVKATYLGLRHPSSIIKDNYLYIFYIDGSLGEYSTGRGRGTKIARAPITPNGIDPLSFKTYYNGSFSDFSLPAGFQKENIMQYFSQKGGRSSPILFNNNSFSAAKIIGTNLYIGVADDLNIGTTLQLSDDLIHWSQPTVIPGAEYNYNGGGVDLNKVPFNYARLAHSNGDTSSEIDPNNFYVIGTTIGINPFNSELQSRIVNKVRLSLQLPSLVCAPNVTAYLNNCIGMDPFNANPRDPACITSSRQTSLNLNALNADYVQIASAVPYDTDCSNASDSAFSQAVPYKESYSVELPQGDGNKKVCVKLINSANQYLPAKCGARIELNTSLLVADANGDGLVDGRDYVVWAGNYNKSVTGPTYGDFDNNSIVDGRDYVIWMNNYGT